MTVAFQVIQDTDIAVSEAMFGANDLFLYDRLSGANATFPIAASLLGTTGLRYPGGAMTETDFDVTHPDAAPPSQASDPHFQGVSEFLQFTKDSGREATIVLPTAKMYAGSPDADHDAPRPIDAAYFQDVIGYVEKLLTQGDSGQGSLPDAPVARFEIGNEYWGSGQMTAAEYGQLVNVLTAALGEVFDRILGTDASHPEVVIQMGGPWDPQYDKGLYSQLTWTDRVQQCNQDIIEQISDPGALATITGLVEHYYYRDTNDVLVQNSPALDYIDRDLAQWGAAGFSDLDLYITEWNVRRSNVFQLGLKGASVVIEQMEHMLELGVDGAFVWPLQGGSTGLAGPVGSTPQLTPVGAAFQLMSESLIGTDLVLGNMSEGSIEVDAFSSNSKVVLFVMSRAGTSQFVDIDVSSLVQSYVHLEGTKIGISAGVSVMDPFAYAVITDYNGFDLGGGTLLQFNLGSFEVMRVEFDLVDVTKDPLGVAYTGSPQGDKFSGGLGDDSLSGAHGDDSLIGGKGADLINGGRGDDLLNGWGGNDQIRGGKGSDQVYSQDGNDLILGGDGRDMIRSATGDDTLVGGDGSDTLDGAGGSDEIEGCGGRDVLFGGAGADVFIFGLSTNDLGQADLIGDFEGGVDIIHLDLASNLSSNTFSFGMAKLGDYSFELADSPLPSIAYDAESGDLWFDRDGSGSTFVGVVFAKLVAGLALTSESFVMV